MTGTFLFLIVGSFLLVILVVFVRRSGLSETKIAGPTQAYEALTTLQSELLPEWFVDRLFSKEDRAFARSQEAPEILRLFDTERKSVALSWLRQTEDYVAQLMDFHVRLSRQRPDLRPSTEVKLTLEYLQFQFLCKVLAAMIRIVGLCCSFTARYTSPKQHFPDGFLTSQAQLPALTSALIRLATVDFPVLPISFQMSCRAKPKQ